MGVKESICAMITRNQRVAPRWSEDKFVVPSIDVNRPDHEHTMRTTSRRQSEDDISTMERNGTDPRE